MDDRPSVKLVDNPREADYSGILLELFEDGADVMGWYIGPIETRGCGRTLLPYYSKSRRAPAAVALVAAMGSALVSRSNICILDPEHLWPLL